MGLIAMSERDLPRIEVLSKVVAGRMTTVSAANVLGLSERQPRRLFERIFTGGAASILHRTIAHRPEIKRNAIHDYKTRGYKEYYDIFLDEPCKAQCSSPKRYSVNIKQTARNDIC